MWNSESRECYYFSAVDEDECKTWISEVTKGAERMLPKSTNGESVVVFYYPKDQVQMGDVTHHVTKSGSDHTSESVNEYSSVAKTVVHMPGTAVLIFTCTCIYMYMYLYLHVLIFTCIYTCIFTLGLGRR